MNRMIVVAGTAGSGKTQSLLQLACVNSQSGFKESVVWNGETTIVAINERISKIGGRVSVINPQYGDCETDVQDVITKSSEYGFNLFIDDPSVRLVDDSIDFGNNDLLNKLVDSADVVYVSAQLRRRKLK